MDFNFFKLLMGALAVEGSEDDDDIEKDLFQPLPCLVTEQNTPPPPSSEHTSHHKIAVSSMRSPVASGQKALKKRLRSKEHKWKQRAMDLPIGGHRKTRSSMNHLHASSPLKTVLQMHKLRVTKPGFTAIREKEVMKVEHSLDEMVGTYHFELKEWDGR